MVLGSGVSSDFVISRLATFNPTGQTGIEPEGALCLGCQGYFPNPAPQA